MKTGVLEDFPLHDPRSCNNCETDKFKQKIAERFNMFKGELL